MIEIWGVIKYATSYKSILLSSQEAEITQLKQEILQLQNGEVTDENDAASSELNQLKIENQKLRYRLAHLLRVRTRLILLRA